MEKWDLVIIGGGAAGFFSAVNCAELCPGVKILILESTKSPLSKVKISGGGRCNITNAESRPKLLTEAYPRGKKELLGPFHKFSSAEMRQWLTERELKTKTEPDGRVFPLSNSSQSVIDLFLDLCKNLDISIKTDEKVEIINREDQFFAIHTQNNKIYTSSRLLIATGNHPSGYNLAKMLGHKIVSPLPSLFSFKTADPMFQGLMGLSFNKVILSSPSFKKKYEIRGPMLITHWGLSGPAVLKFSSFAALDLHKMGYKIPLNINFFAEKNFELAKQEFLYQLEKALGKKMGNSNPEFIPRRFWERVLRRFNIPLDSTLDSLGKKTINEIFSFLFQFNTNVTGKGPFKEEFVTAGGIDLKQVNFQSMESKVVPKCYLAGEILNIDGITGGYNFQNAWTTGILCARDIADKIKGQRESR